MAMNVMIDLGIAKLVLRVVDKAREVFKITRKSVSAHIPQYLVLMLVADKAKGTKMEAIEAALVRFLDFTQNKIMISKRTIPPQGEG